MKKTFGALLILAVIAGIFIWFHIWNSDERLIKQALQECAEAVAFSASESPAAAILKLRGLEKHLDRNVEITLRVNRKVINTALERREIISRTAAVRKMVKSLAIDLYDLEISVNNSSAIVESSVQLHAESGKKEKYPSLEEVTFKLRKEDGKWLITSLKAHDFMER